MDAATDSILLKPDIVHPSQPSILMPQETQPVINYSPKKKPYHQQKAIPDS